MIQISISPNLEKDDLLRTIKMLFSPINWFNFRFTQELEKQIGLYFGKHYKAIAVNSGRSAMYIILKTLEIGSGDEVIIQSFTCSAAVNPVLWVGANPIYADIDKDFNIDPSCIEKLITERTKAVVIQHTFGMPAQIDKIVKICKKYNIKLIEDCAVALGATYKNKKVGTFSDFAFLSFGRDKVISSVFGGAIVVSDNKYYTLMRNYVDNLKYPSFLWTVKQLIHPLLTYFALKLYSLSFGKYSVGKIFMFLLVKFKLIDRPVYSIERYARKPEVFPSKIPGCLAYLAILQLSKIKRFNSHRKIIANIYFNNLKKIYLTATHKNTGAIYLRFPILVKNQKNIINKAKQNNIILGDWYKDIISAANNLRYFKYFLGSCPASEKAAKSIINLPTAINIDEKRAKLLCNYINRWE